MLKVLFIFTTFFNISLLYDYIFKNILPDKITIISWGIIVCLQFTLYVITLFFKDTIKYKQQERNKLLATKINEIGINNNLTDQEKSDKIYKVLKENTEVTLIHKEK